MPVKENSYKYFYHIWSLTCMLYPLLILLHSSILSIEKSSQMNMAVMCDRVQDNEKSLPDCPQHSYISDGEP